jgi:DNA-binding LacI/PurR family transcriptional regulator
MGRAPTGRPTSFDIAYLAGVSQPTVSRALRGDRSVSHATRERIQKIAADLNYTVDKNASSLRSQRTHTIALLFFEDGTDENLINPFFLAMLGSITRACANHGLDLLISFQRMEDDWHMRYQDAKRADGLILLGYGDYALYSARIAELVAHGTHFARWGSIRSDRSGATVGSDNRGAGRLAGEHLLACGRRHIAFLGHADEHYPEFEHRYEGLCAALRDGGVEPDRALQFDALTSEDAGYRAASALLASGRAFDAIFAASDLIAIGAMRALAGARRKVPEDVAVVGFDNIPAASLTSPPLTTIQQDIAGAGEALVETVLAQIEGRDPPEPHLPTRLIVRGSTVAA